MGEGITKPWKVLGDFNMLLTFEDKVGDLQIMNYELQYLENLVHSRNLVDLQSKGYSLTWTNGIVSCKLDGHW